MATLKQQSHAESVKGINLRYRLGGSQATIYRVAWSPDGSMLAAPTSAAEIRLWRHESPDTPCLLHGHSGAVFSVAWSPDAKKVISGPGNGDYTVRIWEVESCQTICTITEHDRAIVSVAWSPDGNHVACGDLGGSVTITDLAHSNAVRRIARNYVSINSLAWAPSGRYLAGAADSHLVVLWSADSWTAQNLEGHRGRVYGVAWSPDARILASASADGTIRIWDHAARKLTTVIEGHTDMIYSVSFSHDGRLLASKSADGTVRLWRTDTWETAAIIKERTERSHWAYAVAFHPSRPLLATMDDGGTAIRVWDVDTEALFESAPAVKSVHYTTAKITLVGDSGVGKTGLGWRLAHGSFKEHASTHGQQFWVIDELGKTRADGTECEAVLWDLAGQPDYRLVHSLFLDDVDLALILFDPTKREDPLSGVGFWVKQLTKGRNEPRRSILVGARSDRGSSALTSPELDAYCNSQNINGGYLAISALTGDGLDALMKVIKSLIPWDEMASTVTTDTFKRIKQFLLLLKEDPSQKDVLVTPELLRARLLTLDDKWLFTDGEMMTAVRHLETHGYVTLLRTSIGDASVLLFPDILVNLASSFVLEARRNVHGLGVLDEDKVLLGSYSFPELDGLAKEEAKTLLDATAVLFLEHNVCFRETFNDRTFLVFPSLINEKRPRTQESDSYDDAAYKVSGAVENVYASLVVLLGYTNTFTRTHQWHDQAQYELTEDEICGFRQVAEHEGEIELVLFFGKTTKEHTRLLFKGLFERFLSRNDLVIEKYDPVNCQICGERQERAVVIKQLEKGRSSLYCSECGEHVQLARPGILGTLSRKDSDKLNQEQRVVKRRTAFEAALVRVKSLAPGITTTYRPSCFISYAWGVPEHEKWVLDLAKDLRNAGVDAILDRWHNQPGTSISKFIDRIDNSDIIICVGTPELLRKYQTRDSGSAVDAELRLISTLLRSKEKDRQRVIPVLLAGNSDQSFPPMLRDSVYIDFKDRRRHFVSLFELILTILGIPFDHPSLDELRHGMV